MSEHTPLPIKFPIHYNKNRQMFFDADGKHIADLRGWGHIQYLPNATEQHDQMGEFIAEAVNSHAKLIAENKRLREALNKIAYEPIGPTDASPTEVLQGCVDIARQALNESE